MSNELFNVEFFYETEEEKKEIFDLVEKNKQVIKIFSKQDEDILINQKKKIDLEIGDIEIIEKFERLNVFTKSFIVQKNEEKLFNFLDKKLTNFNTSCLLFKTLKKNVESRTLSYHKNYIPKFIPLLKDIKFNFDKLTKFVEYEFFKKKYLIFDEKEENEFNENFKKIQEIYNKDQEKQKKISKKFINEILFEIVKFLDLLFFFKKKINF
jgi:hypothetical protein